MWKDCLNGDRRYKVDFSNQITTMGTYHLIGGKKVRIVYPGNVPTCGSCHNQPSNCPGNGIANKCRENNGTPLNIHQHMERQHDKLRKIRVQQAQVSAAAQPSRTKNKSVPMLSFHPPRTRIKSMLPITPT